MYKKNFPGFAGPPYLGGGSYLPGGFYYVTVGTKIRFLLEDVADRLSISLTVLLAVVAYKFVIQRQIIQVIGAISDPSKGSKGLACVT